MSKKSQKKYAPGELSKTRKNIGKISEQEAKKMMKKLGGEIGVEKDAEDILNKYKKLKDRSTNRVILRKEMNKRIKTVDGKGGTIPEKVETGKNKKEGKKKDSPSFIDRIKMDFLCSTPEFRLKPLSGAIASLFSIIMQVPDNVNPDFIKKARTRFFTYLYDFVTAVRALYKKSNPDAFKIIGGNKYISQILGAIKNWDLSSIDIELSILRKRTSRLNISKLRKLSRLIYFPFGILYDLSYEDHIRKAITWAYEVNKACIEKRGGIQHQNKKFYEEAIKLLPTVFDTIKKLFYPLISKLITKKYYFYEDFLLQERNNILNFLGISSGQVIQPEEMEGEKFLSVPGDKEQEEIREEENEHNKDDVPGTDKNHSIVSDGIKLLEFLFPQAGWGKLEYFPDLYPYFQPIFRFPPGFELIPNEDPLHQVFILVSIIGNLLYGFRHIEFLSVRNERLELQSIKSNIDSFLALWPAYMNDIIGKFYISRLQDYCRNIEKDHSFIKTEVASKIEIELNYLKKTYFLPYQHIEFQRKISMSIKKNVPKLYFITSEIIPILEKVTREINVKMKEKRTRELNGEGIKFADLKCESVKNPWKKMVFDLENPLSKRLQNLLYRQVKDAKGRTRSIDRRSNANLIIYTYTLLRMLDYIINKKSSHLYHMEQKALFRSIRNEGKTPQYSVPLVDSGKYLRMSLTSDAESVEDKEQTSDQKEQEIQFRTMDPGTEELKREIEQVVLAQSNFSIILLHVFPLSGGGTKTVHATITGAVKSVTARILRHLLDIPFSYEDNDIIILLKNKDLNGSIGIVRRIVKDLRNHEGFNERQYRLSAGVIQFQTQWQSEKFVKLINKIKLILKKQNIPRIVFIDRDAGSIKALNLV